MLNMLHIKNKYFSRLLYGVEDVTFNVFFDDHLNIKELRSSRGSNDIRALSDYEKHDLKEFIKEDIAITAVEFEMREHTTGLEHC